ncbi:MAG: hypothetical protein WBA23_00855 [Tunicatimonas sp.]|uniref:hypothetical protein n=1 Tax=Tunicatimonas sp. TaxID=1940096 RepID=UPI003C72A365
MAVLFLSGTLKDTIIDDFLDRFVIPEQQAIIPLMVFASLAVALYYIPGLAAKLRRGDYNFNASLTRWFFGLVLIFGLPPLLAKVILNKSVTEVTSGTVNINDLKPSAYATQASLDKSINAQKLNLQNYVFIKTPFEAEQYKRLGNDKDAVPSEFGYKVWYPEGLK